MRPSLPLLAFANILVLQVFGVCVEAQEQFTFRHQNPVLGEQWVNSVQFNMRMKTRYRYPGQEPQETSNHDQQQQLRRLTILDVKSGYSSRVRVHFEKAVRQVGETDQKDYEWLSQPVAGKTYIVERVKDKLIVTDPDGNLPEEEELMIVRHSMEAVGRPNPLATFLNGRTVSVGDTVYLPGHQASCFLGSRQEGAESQKMPMKREKVQDIDGVTCGLFSAQLKSVTHEGPRTSSHMSGHFAVQLNTCRIVHVNFQGPVTFRQTRIIANQEYVVEATGSLAVAMKTASAKR